MLPKLNENYNKTSYQVFIIYSAKANILKFAN